eukprot:TRINITY_DN603_c0_g2_i1.p1 TRINITY_DN603_c0_g2~~TRINITY_DN603_c0_g2_i1.p1  ORF type:complete len:100 (+),score=1.62 TRINITY_DN603_c0_g2_i1:705-1004(+)
MAMAVEIIHIKRRSRRTEETTQNITRRHHRCHQQILLLSTRRTQSGARYPMKHDPNKKGTLLHYYWPVLGGNYHCVKFLLDYYYPGFKLDAEVVGYGCL